MAARGLADLQRLVTDVVRLESPVTEHADVAAEVDAVALPSARGMTPCDRLEVYRTMFWWRHLSSLEEDFPTLMQVLGGKDAFRELATHYLTACPPRTWDLQRLGADLPAFVAQHPRHGSDGLAGDAARLDWAFMEAFDAPDAPPFDPHILASAPEDAWPGARITLHPSLRALALDHPVHDLREGLRAGQAPALPTAAPTHLVVHRDASCFLHAVAIEPQAFALLVALREGAPLGEACETCARAVAQDPLDVGVRLGAWFQEWTARAWVTTVTF